jgi:GST-like protein
MFFTHHGLTMTKQGKPIDLYYAATPNGRKITIALEELGVPYKLIAISISRGDQFKPEFLAIAPNNKIPAIVDPEGPDGQPISIFESGAILKYLAEKFGALYGKTPRERVKIDEWLFWQVGGFGPILGQTNHFSHYAKEKVEYAITRFNNESHRLYRVLNTQLEKMAGEGKDYVAGDFSIADCAIFDWSNGYLRHSIDMSEFPFLEKWRARVAARPAVAKALAIKLEAPPVDIARDADAQKVLFNQR